ncbi:MAG: iron-containing alcohol dehydrogenase, partial [Clostridia bacterium]|nr:iron-containing alcohol dehydrogenase [Clostridia bacterium]
IAEFLGFHGRSEERQVEQLIEAITELKKKVGIKNTMKDYGVDEKYFWDTLDEMSEKAFDDQCTGANPRYPLISEIKEMFIKNSGFKA